MNVHVIIGEDDYLVSSAARKVIGDGVGLEVVDSLNSTNADLQLADIRRADDSFSTPPFLDPEKVTWWRNVHFLPGGRKAVAEDVKSALAAFAAKVASAELPENQRLVVSGPHLLKTSDFAKKLAPCAEFVVFAAGKPWEAARFALGRAVEMAAAQGLGFASGAAERFVATVGCDCGSMANEIAKLREYLGGERSEIMPDDIDAITSPGTGMEPEVWSLTDAIGRRNLAAALDALGKFEGSGFAVFATTVVEKFFRQLLDIAAGRTEGLSQFALRKNGEFLRNWTVPELRAARYRFMMLREQAVSGMQSADALVVTTLVRTARRARR